MKHYSKREFIRILKANDFCFKRNNGGHSLYYNDAGKHVAIPYSLADVIARRLIKENNLTV